MKGRQAILSELGLVFLAHFKGIWKALLADFPSDLSLCNYGKDGGDEEAASCP